ncbi:MAG: hypothetical protein MZU95_03880 [Desulfomicrobium escambiense]|nr:hypothetical protein [Desulfomicrobium escambiense]
MDRFFLDKDDAVLLIVDIQDRLAAAMKMRDPVVSNTIHLIELCKMCASPSS